MWQIRGQYAFLSKFKGHVSLMTPKIYEFVWSTHVVTVIKVLNKFRFLYSNNKERHFNRLTLYEQRPLHVVLSLFCP